MNDDWELYVRKLEVYFDAHSVIDDKIKLAKMLYYGEIVVQDRSDTIPGAKVKKTENNDVYEIALEKFTAYFAPKKSVAFERHIFYKMEQKKNEIIEEFAHRLRQQVVKCKFKSDVDEYIRDQIANNTNSDDLRSYILRNDELTLEKVITEGKTIEALRRHKKSFSSCFGCEHGWVKFKIQALPTL